MTWKCALLMAGLALAAAWAPGDEESLPAAVAEYALGGERGVISDQELRLYARVAGFKFADPLAVYLGADDPGETEDAAYFVNEGIEEILWNRHYALMARAAKFILPAARMEEVAALQRECLTSKLKLQLRDNVTTLTLSDAWKLIADDKAEFDRPELRFITYVFKALPPEAPMTQTEALRLDMERLRAAVFADAMTLEDAARQFSEAPSAALGGKLGPLSRDQGLNPRFAEFVFSASPDTLTPAVRLHNGFYFCRVDQIIPAVTLPAEGSALPPDIMDALLERRRRDAVVEAIQAARAAHPNAANDDDALVTHYYGPRLEPTGECGAMAALLEERLLARNYFAAANEKAVAPAEADIEQYYRDFPAEMTDRRRFRFALYEVAVPYEPGAAVKTLDDALRLARAARAAAMSGAGTNEAAMTAAGGALTITESDWAESAGVMALDMDMLKLAPGEFTDVHADGDRAVFAKLAEKREPPLRPLAEMRGYIEANVEAGNINRLYQESLDALIQEAKLKHLWMNKTE